MSRNKNDDPNRDIHIKIKVTEEERKAIKLFSAETGISVSDLIRLGLNTIGGFGLEYGNKKRATKKESD